MDLISYIENYLKPASTAVAQRMGGGVPSVPSRALAKYQPNVIDGEWSEVPKELSGPGQNALVKRVLNGEVQPPVHETAAKPAARMGPTIEGELASAAPGASQGMMARLASSPLLAAIMGSVYGDVLNNHVPKMYGSSLPANPTPQVNSSALPPVAPAAPQAAPQAAAAPAQAGASPTDPQQGSGSIPWWANAQGADFSSPAPQQQHIPMPQPRPAAAYGPDPGVNPNGSIAGAQGPTSVQGAPLQPQQSMNFFQRNAAMMRDPSTGQFIDPQAASQAQASGNNNVVQAIMQLLGRK